MVRWKSGIDFYKMKYVSIQITESIFNKLLKYLLVITLLLVLECQFIITVIIYYVLQ
jgi:hypothetical protein